MSYFHLASLHVRFAGYSNYKSKRYYPSETPKPLNGWKTWLRAAGSCTDGVDGLHLPTVVALGQQAHLAWHPLAVGCPQREEEGGNFLPGQQFPQAPGRLRALGGRHAIQLGQPLHVFFGRAKQARCGGGEQSTGRGPMHHGLARDGEKCLVAALGVFAFLRYQHLGGNVARSEWLARHPRPKR
jgi:hypothetical protein